MKGLGKMKGIVKCVIVYRSINKKHVYGLTLFGPKLDGKIECSNERNSIFDNIYPINKKYMLFLNLHKSEKASCGSLL